MAAFSVRSLKLLLASGPIGHDAIHERMEPWPVVRLEKVAEFVNDHVFQTLRRIECKTDVEADASCFRLATAPAALHVAIGDRFRTNIQNSRPLFDQGRNASFHDRAPRFDLFFARRFSTCRRGGGDARLLLADPTYACSNRRYGVWLREHDTELRGTRLRSEISPVGAPTSCAFARASPGYLRYREPVQSSEDGCFVR